MTRPRPRPGPGRYGATGGWRSLLGRRPPTARPDAVQRQKLLRVGGRSVAWLPPLLLLVAIAVLDWNTVGEFRIVSWIVLVPGIAAAICGVRGTAALAVLSLGAYVLVDNSWPHQYQTGLPDFILVAVGGILATLACAVRVRGEQRMLHMRDVAETTRRTLLRPLAPGWGDLDHAAVYLAADSEARVGGDFYDIQPGLHGTRVLLGDVQGKGLGAVEAAAALLGTFRESAYHEPRLHTVADRLEVRMLRHVRYCAAIGRDDGDRFATGILVGFPETAATDTVEVINFGHEPPLVIAPDGVRSLPSGDGLPLGLSELTYDPPPLLRVPLAPGETLLLVTDGVTEARDAAGVFFPLRDRVAQALAEDPRTAEPHHLVQFVRDGTLLHAGGHLVDDTTIFAVRRPERTEAVRHTGVEA
ncbi:PP2C family protein-serine/threonine phosphatase [Streptomyces sp. NBC_01236]|uniref:PP2C family protein-serine/threonine phosphatase n=1 Tax=Streptomyces sp. NBC_01236 TaxID=2903789 RepID=UPI002E142E38|nr:serine/threonine-protein phosphatase [Streptomyces sp. NBC_01236]